METISKEILSLEEKRNEVRENFGLADYFVFAATVIISSAVGLYYSFKGRSTRSGNEAEEYLLGGRNMSVIPIAMSLLAGYISGVSYLGVPTEMYLHGTEHMFVVIGFLMAAYLGSQVFLPVFHDLKVSSSYEYLSLRFDGKVRTLGSVLFIIHIILWMPIVIYAPAMALSQVSGVNIHIITFAVCLLCIAYTCVGGLKAVVWSDVVQMSLMVAAIFALAIKGTIDVGGLDKVWRLNWESDRIEVPSFSFDPTIRQSMMSLTIWSVVNMLQTGVVSQHSMQRYLTLSTLSQARRALWIFLVSYIIYVLIGGYTGLLAYATFHDCDPLTTGLAKAKDQLLPFFAMRVLGRFPGMPGLFIAGIFGSGLSSLSTGLNSVSSVILEDFIKPNRRTPLSDRATRYILRGVVVIFGVCCLALVFVVENLGTVLQLSIFSNAITNGAGFGLSFGGLLLPYINAKGALWGSISGISLCTLFVVGAQRALVTGAVVNHNKMTSVEGCDYNFTTPITATLVNATVSAESSNAFFLYRLSYLYYIAIGWIITIVCSLFISYFTGGNDYMNMDPRFFSPIIRRWLPKPATTVTAAEEQELLGVKAKAQDVE